MSRMPDTFKLHSQQALLALFQSAQGSELPEQAYQRSCYGPVFFAGALDVHVLDFEPWIGLARRCGMTEFSLLRSRATGRLYAWNLNNAGHGARLELRPLRLEHLCDLERMYQLHRNHGLELGLQIDLQPAYAL